MVLVDVEEKDAALGEETHVATAGGGEFDGVLVKAVELRPDGLLEVDEDQDGGLLRQAIERRRRRIDRVHHLLRHQREHPVPRHRRRHRNRPRFSLLSLSLSRMRFRTPHSRRELSSLIRKAWHVRIGRRVGSVGIARVSHRVLHFGSCWGTMAISSPQFRSLRPLPPREFF